MSGIEINDHGAIGLNDWNEPLLMSPTFVHPKAGQYKDKPEEFFRDKAVRIYVAVDVEGHPMQAAVWLDVVRFDDQVIDGHPMRLGLGRVQRGVQADIPVAAGLELSFHPAEVFDVIERLPEITCGEYRTLAVAPPDAPIVT